MTATTYPGASQPPKRGTERAGSSGTDGGGLPGDAADTAPPELVVRKRGSLASNVAARIAASVAHAEANQVVTRIPAGSFEPVAARSATTLVGRIARPAVLIARKSTMALVAVPFTGFHRFSSCIARIADRGAPVPRSS